MDNDHTSVRALIAGYKACERPSAATEARIRRVLEAAQRETSARPAPARVPARRAANLPWLALAAGLVLLLAWQLGWPRTEGLAASRGDRPELSPFGAATTGPGLEATARAPGPPTPAITPRLAGDDPSDAAEPPLRLAPAAERARLGDGERSRTGTRPRAPAAADPTSTVIEEMELLQRAQEVLRADRPDEALALLDHHVEAFRSGNLVEERQALRITALCAAGRSTQGLAARAEFLRAYPHSAYAGRVNAACPDRPQNNPQRP